MSRNLYVIGHLESRRTRFFIEAVRRTKLKWQIISWDRVLFGSDKWLEGIEPESSVRIDSPGQAFAIEKAILALGALDGTSPFTQFSAKQLEALPYEKGRILAIDQWYRGWSKALHLIESRLKSKCVRYFNSPEDIAVMFDKPECNARLKSCGVSTPPVLGQVRSFDELMVLMRSQKCPRVFVKPCYSSSASGIIALEIRGRRQQAFSTIELVHEGAEVKLFNSRDVRRYESLSEIRALVDAIFKENVYVERWLPKAGFAGKRFDLRIVVIGGTASHVVVRLSDHPMTNLHLGARRGDPALLRATMGAPAWSSAMQMAERAMDAFPHSFYSGIDLLVSPGWKKAHVLEVNAFGDFLPGILYDGLDAFTYQLNAWENHVSATGL